MILGRNYEFHLQIIFFVVKIEIHVAADKEQRVQRQTLSLLKGDVRHSTRLDDAQ